MHGQYEVSVSQTADYFEARKVGFIGETSASTVRFEQVGLPWVWF